MPFAYRRAAAAAASTLVLAAVTAAAPLPAYAGPPAEFDKTVVAADLEEPTAFRFMPDGGILIVGPSSIPNTNKLIVNGGQVKATGTEVVNTLFFGAVQQVAGTWGASGSGATHIDDTRFTGASGVVSVISGPDFSAWAAANAPGQTIDQDHDNDGVSNGIEYFMGLTGSGFTANPGLVAGNVSWPKGADYVGTYGVDYVVQTSINLSTWIDVLVTDPNLNNGNPVEFTPPAGNSKHFSRLKVTGP